MRSLYSNGSITDDELNSWLDFVDIEYMQSLADFKTSSERYIKSKREDDYNDGVKKYKKVVKASTHKAILSNFERYASKNFLNMLNDNVATANRLMSEMSDLHNKEVIYQKEVAVKEAKLNQERIILEESNRKSADEKRAKYNKEYTIAIGDAKGTLAYKGLELRLEVCCAIENKTSLESTLAEDLKYARKYGVINIADRGRIVEQIKNDDIMIAEGKNEYKKVFGKPFAVSQCKTISCETAEVQLGDLAHKIAVESIEKGE